MTRLMRSVCTGREALWERYSPASSLLAAVNAGLGNDPSGKPIPLGWVDGHPRQLLNQAIGVGIAWGLALVGTLIILKIVDLLLGVRVSTEQEIEGLDLSMHGEEGYNLDA